MMLDYEVCDWNPAAVRLALTTDEPHAEAVWSIGVSQNFHLCRSCAALPRFKRFRRRDKLKAFDNPTPGAPQT